MKPADSLRIFVLRVVCDAAKVVIRLIDAIPKDEPHSGAVTTDPLRMWDGARAAEAVCMGRDEREQGTSAIEPVSGTGRPADDSAGTAAFRACYLAAMDEADDLDRLTDWQWRYLNDPDWVEHPQAKP